MSNLKQAVDQIKNFGGRIRGILEAAEILEGIANIEELEKELISRKTVAQKELDRVLSLTEKAKEESKETLVELSKIESEAQSRIEKANEMAGEIIEKANGDAHIFLNKKRLELQGIENDIKEANEVLYETQDEIESKNKELSLINTELQKTKEKFAQFMR